MKPTSRRLVLVATILALSLVPYRPARAFTVLGFGADAEEIVAALGVLQAAVTNLQHAGNDLLSGIKSVQDEMARDLGYEQFRDLTATLTDAQRRLIAIQTDLERIGYSEATIRSQFTRVFPQDAAAWRNVRYSDYDALYTSWHSQIMASTAAATRAQVSLTDVHGSNQRAAEILARAANNRSEIQQLQTHNQMLALVQNNLTSILQSLTSQGRVVSEMAATSASEKQAIRTLNQQRVEHYGDPHPSPVVLQRMPPMQAR